jgi:S1-C subfamily serine protease
MNHRPCFLRALTTVLLAVEMVSSAPAGESQPPSPPATIQSIPSPAANAIENSVVKVFSTVRYPDLYRPWTTQAPAELSGSGVVIEGHRILTNAHVVLYAKQIQVQANQAGDKISATVVAIAPGIDLAVLQLDDDSFFDIHPPLPRANTLPEIKDAVLAYGFPTGGATLSITKGIVSRIEFTPYNFPVSGLRIQIDAAINPGNSGGPAIAGDKMIGLAFSHLGNAQNIGYIIPNEEIELFLQDIADGRYDGKPAMFDMLQTLENPALRSYLHLDKSVEGIVVHQPDRSDPSYPLKQWDVITMIGDTTIDDQGMIKLGANLRVSFRYLIQHVAKDGQVSLTIVRNQKILKVQLPVIAERPMLLRDLKGEYPSYFIYGPLVFSRATVPFLSFLANNANLMNAFSFIRSPLVLRRGDFPAFADEELVVISSPFFPHKLSKGYADPSGGVVKSVNGHAVRNLGHLVEILRESKEEFLVIESDHRGGETLVFQRKEALAATDEILNDNGVRAQGSPDMLAVWNAKADTPAASP